MLPSMSRPSTESPVPERLHSTDLGTHRADALAAQVRELQRENAELHRVIAELRQQLRRRTDAS